MDLEPAVRWWNFPHFLMGGQWNFCSACQIASSSMTNTTTLKCGNIYQHFFLLIWIKLWELSFIEPFTKIRLCYILCMKFYGKIKVYMHNWVWLFSCCSSCRDEMDKHILSTLSLDKYSIGKGKLKLLYVAVLIWSSL